MSIRLQDKRRFLTILEDIDIDHAEGGYPGSSGMNTALFTRQHNLPSTPLGAFGVTRCADGTVEDDTGFRRMLELAAKHVCLVATSSVYHVRVSLGISNEENLAMVCDSVAAIVTSDRQSTLNCERLFDGFKSNPRYTLQAAAVAYASGARWVLCDTKGGMLPHETERASSGRPPSTCPGSASASTPTTTGGRPSPTHGPLSGALRRG